MDHAGRRQEGRPQVVGRRAVLARGAAATALVWAAPAVVSTQRALAAPGSPPPGPRRQTVTLVSRDAATGTPDPLVQVLVGGVWRSAVAVRNGFYVPLPGTGFVDAGGTCAGNSTFVFRVPFELPPGATSPSVTGQTQGDNYVGSVRLNGSGRLGGQAPSDSTSAFDGTTVATFGTADAALFTTGTNFLFFDLTNNGCPMAVDLRAVVSYDA